MTVESSNSMGYSGGETRRLKISNPEWTTMTAGIHMHTVSVVSPIFLDVVRQKPS